MKAHHPVRGMRKQRGLVAVIVTIALFAFLGIAVLAIDINHAYTNRTKLQNSVDAAALAAAVVLDNEGTDEQAKAAANYTLSAMSESLGNSELDFTSEAVSISITFSNSPKFTGTYVSSPNMDRYARVEVSNIKLKSFFIQIFNIDKTLHASALAGISAGGGTCNLAPMAVCAEPGTGPIESPGATSDYGYVKNNVYALKLATSGSDLGAGNFQLLDFDSDSKLSEQMAGNFNECAIPSGTVLTKPGGTIGPVGKGINSRFGDVYNSITLPDNYHADEVVDEAYLIKPSVYSSLNSDDLKDILGIHQNDDFLTVDQAFELYDTAVTELENNTGLTSEEQALYTSIKSTFSSVTSSDITDAGEVSFNYEIYLQKHNSLIPENVNHGLDMRLIAVPIIDCSADVNNSETPTGKSEFNVVDLGCFFLLKRAPDNNGAKEDIYGEFFETCDSKKILQTGESNSSGAHRIVLYDDPFNKDS
ncbi:pilus assembly protein TadG-related protein [Vibrio diazotrophicus]|uniref:pilus assembly protein TadG-related protein n=1 Tax=Vibrio diazotrophicus TaxID=685 RepID=UPI00142DFB9E|nr:pilus assembly protein TadG-related protein [Vibrio diazotrophicus]NIY91357.1 hypothetical protein [Vibrio diazotrophicus]